MHIYSLTPKGYALSHSIRNPDTPEWRLIHYLARMHQASRDRLINEISGVTGGTLAKLRLKGIITEESRVGV